MPFTYADRVLEMSCGCLYNNHTGVTTHYCENHSPEINELKNILDDAAEALAKLDGARFEKWVSYLLEAIEEEYGEAGLYQTEKLLKERFRNGRW
jgi:hypothetical protein